MNYKEVVSGNSNGGLQFEILTDTGAKVAMLTVNGEVSKSVLRVTIIESDGVDSAILVVLFQRFIAYMNDQGHEDFRLLVKGLNSKVANELINQMENSSYIDKGSYQLEERLTVLVCGGN